MNSKTFWQRLVIVMIFAMLAESCRPPNLTEDAVDRSTSRMGEQDVYPRHTGQSPPAIRLEYNLDPRPDYIRAADNPDYDRNSNPFSAAWNAVFSRLSDRGRLVETQPELKPGDKVTHFPPSPKDDQIDTYDFHSGRVTVDPTVGMDSDPDVQEMRNRQAVFEEEMKRRQQLSEQRDYLEGKAKDDVARFNQRKVEGFSRDLLKQIDDLKGEIDASIIEHNSAVDQMIHDDVKVTEIRGPNGYIFKTSANTINGQKVRSAQYAINSAQKSVSQLTEAARERGEAILGVAQNAVIVGDKAYANGDQAGGDFAVEMATVAVDVGLGLIPGVGLAKDFVEAATGYSIVTGKKLSGFERTMAVVGILTAGYGSKLKYLAKAGTLTEVLAAAGKNANEVAEISASVKKASGLVENALEAGAKTGAETLEAVKVLEPSAGKVWKTSRVNQVAATVDGETVYKAKNALDYDHVFSADHIQGGIMNLGKDRADIIKQMSDNVMRADQLGKLKEGSNQILTRMNGQDATIRAFFKGTELQSINCFSGNTAREIGNVINLR